MLFNSIIYFLFLGGSLFVYYLIPAKYRNYFLILASLIFYMYVRIEYVFIILFIILINYLIGIRIEKAAIKKKRSLLLNLSLIINLGVLIFFKYWNFLISNLFELLGVLKWQNSNAAPVLNIALPIGLSYYIFQTIGYTTDVYRGTLKAETSITRFGLFTLFFPKLLVGPIERGSSFLPQLKKLITFEKQNLIEGSKRIAWGLFKKLVVADRISIYHSYVIGTSEYQSGETILFACILYTFQVYADFSGYTDIALGTAKMFGYDLMENFKRPLLAKNVSEFWRRWHISLSSWVNDYIFNPIVLKRRDWRNWGIVYGLTISFVVIGIWHGASWNYVLFGVLQAIAIIYEFETRKFRKNLSKKVSNALYNWLSMFFTFGFVTFSLIIFQSPTLMDAIQVLDRLFTNSGGFYYDNPSTLFFILSGCTVMMLADFDEEFKLFQFPSFSNKNWLVQQIPYIILLTYILLAGVFDGGQFIYFSF